jgi:hypothetical protein
MTRPANKMRGEASLVLASGRVLLRPSFAALVAAEEELGPLFALVERAAAGELKLAEMVALFWHCLQDADASREAFSENIAQAGLAAMTPALKTLLGQILSGR